MGSINRSRYSFPRLEDYHISSDFGFLSSSPPLNRLPRYFRAWDDIAPQLSSLIASRTLRSRVEDLPLLDASRLESRQELRRAFVILSFLVHAWVWLDGPEKPEPDVPAVIGEPYLAVCERLRVRKTLSYAGLCLWNWRVKDEYRRDGVALLKKLDGLECCLNFTGTRDEEVFYLVPVMIEAEGGRALALLLKAMEAAIEDEDVKTVIATLGETAARMQKMGGLMKLLHERCDPQVFYHQIRPFFPGGKGMEAKGMPDGVVFHRADGTKVGIKAVGGSAAQSSVFPFLDSALGVEHKSLAGAMGETVFDEMRAYMPSEHREFLDDVAKLPSLRTLVERRGDDNKLVEAYNNCLQQLAAWRSKHIGVVTTHIVTPARRSKPVAVRPEPEEVKEGLSVKDESELQGTGGSALIPFLKQAKLETVGARM